VSHNASESREAWGGDPPQPAAARQRLLDATARCIARDGVAATSVAAIAAEAGVSRQTVYRYFDRRGDLVAGALFGATEAVRVKIGVAIAALEDPADMIVETLLLGLAEVQSNPIFRAVWDSSRLGGSVPMAFTEPRGIALVRDYIAPAIEAAGWNDADAEVGAELILRMFLSLVISPYPERTPEELRAFLYRHLIPGLGLLAADEI